MTEQPQQIRLRRDPDGKLARTSEGKYIVDHPRGPSEVTSAELIFLARIGARFARMVASAKTATSE